MASILVIDDNDQFRNTILNMLEREGHTVIGAPNGNVALNIFRDNPVNLVITDILMPEKEGIETIMEFKRDFPEIKIIAMSGGGTIGQDEYLDLARKFGADQTLAKPIRRKDLIESVNTLLGG